MTKIEDATNNDEEAIALMRAIKIGWSNKSQLPTLVQPCFCIHKILTCDKEFILKGERIWIPKRLRNEMKACLYILNLVYELYIVKQDPMILVENKGRN